MATNCSFVIFQQIAIIDLWGYVCADSTIRLYLIAHQFLNFNFWYEVAKPQLRSEKKKKTIAVFSVYRVGYARVSSWCSYFI